MSTFVMRARSCAAIKLASARYRKHRVLANLYAMMLEEQYVAQSSTSINLMSIIVLGAYRAQTGGRTKCAELQVLTVAPSRMVAPIPTRVLSSTVAA